MYKNEIILKIVLLQVDSIQFYVNFLISLLNIIFCSISHKYSILMPYCAIQLLDSINNET